MIYPLIIYFLGAVTQLLFSYENEKWYYYVSLTILTLSLYFTSDIYNFFYPTYNLSLLFGINFFVIKLAYIVIFVVNNYILYFVLKKYKKSLFKIEIISKDTIEKNILLKQQNFDLKELKEEVQIQNEELQSHVEEISLHRDNINEKNKEIIKSITYARGIQEALTPPNENLHSFFNDFFILNKPKDILSGDFYWTKTYETKLIVAVADCTGHGVPAALLSVLGISILNEISLKYQKLTASKILDYLKLNIVTALSNTTDNKGSKNGMDISLIIYDKKNKTMDFAGAYNPLILIREKKILRIDGDRMPIGIFEKNEDFTNHNFKVEENDIIYLFSDGFSDQFGGIDNKKIKRKKYNELLISISEKYLTNQKEELTTFFNKWKGNYEQTDDVLVIGLKI